MKSSEKEDKQTPDTIKRIIKLMEAQITAYNSIIITRNGARDLLDYLYKLEKSTITTKKIWSEQDE